MRHMLNMCRYNYLLFNIPFVNKTAALGAAFETKTNPDALQQRGLKS